VANNLTRSKIEANRKILSLVKPFQNCVQDGLFAAASGGGRRHRELLDTLQKRDTLHAALLYFIKRLSGINGLFSFCISCKTSRILSRRKSTHNKMK